MNSKPLFVIDASGYIYRAYHAIAMMTNTKGESTNALFGFIRSLLKLIKDFKSENIVAVFDGPDNTQNRKNLYSEYKSHRKKMPEDLGHQIDWAKKFCHLSGIPLLTIDGVEADDTIGNIALWAEKNYPSVYLCTTDKDMAQLVTEKINLLNTYKDNFILGPKEVEETFGVPPSLISDWLAMTGDASDNVPGISGIGPKTAADLLKQYGSLDNLLDQASTIPGKKGLLIQEQKEMAKLSKQLVSIHLDIDIPKDPEFFQIKSKQSSDLLEFLKSMNFNSLIKELGVSQTIEASKTYKLVECEEDLNSLISTLREAKTFAIATLTTHSHPLMGTLVGIAFSFEPHKAFYLPFNGSLSFQQAITVLKPLLEDPSIALFGHNIKHDLLVLKNNGIEPKNVCFDTILASYILNSNERQHYLEALCLKYFGKTKPTLEDLTGKGKKQIGALSLPIEKVKDYCGEIVDYIVQLKAIFKKELEERGLKDLFETLELPLVGVLAEMEFQGIYLDVEKLEKAKEKVLGEIEELKKTIFEIAGVEFNLNSPKQLGEVLFQKLNIHPPKKTTTGFSTSAEILESLKNEHPIAEKLLEYRTLEKLRSTYIEKLPEEVNPKTHRIHTTFNQFVAATGRLSSQDPNLQNIPVRNEAGLIIRESFKPENENWRFLSLDYSQIELRLLAHFSQDPVLKAAFIQGEDIHRTTAASVFNLPLQEVTPSMREFSKAVNFGIIYGQGPFGLSQVLKIDQYQAKSFIQTYFDRFPKVREFLEACKEEARKKGKAVTFTGRERAIPEIQNRNPQIRALGERLAVNTPLQGGAADLIKMAMLEIQKEIKKLGLKGYMILQIHDELIFEVPEEEIAIFEKVIKHKMETAYLFDIPLVANVSIGKNWKEC